MIQPINTCRTSRSLARIGLPLLATALLLSHAPPVRGQTVSDGPIRVQLRVRDINTLGAPTDVGVFGATGQPDEHVFIFRARDASDIDGTSWTASTLCQLEAFDPPRRSSDLDMVIFDRVYASVTPDSLEVALDAWEEDSSDQLLGISCGGTMCSHNTNFCCGGFLFGLCLGAIKSDDRHCNAAPFGGIDYRRGRACTTFDHGDVSSTVGGECDNYRPRIETWWRYVNGNTFAAPVELGTLSELGILTHENSTSTVCYSSTDSAVPTPDVFAAVDLPNSRFLRVQVCAAGSTPGVAILDEGGATLATTADGCGSPLVLTGCAGRIVVRVDAGTAAGEDFTLTVEDLPTAYPLGACCGEGTLDRGEVCDDGNMLNTDACVSCAPARCGDGATQTSVEVCDDGPLNSLPNQCDANCTGVTLADCGNGVREAGETCDDGPDNGMPNRCSASCNGITTTQCGNSVVEIGESCDAGTATAACDADCTMVACGDGTLNAAASEVCDDGTDNGTPGNCNGSCTGATLVSCGDGNVDTGEDCDAAGESATCNRDCTTASCGDSVLNTTAGESCDHGSDNGEPLRCDAMCQGITASMCGNSVVEIGEGCDAGSASAACDADCTMVACGDGTLNAAASELCDDGAANGMAGSCNASCSGQTSLTCGDGNLDLGEDCDAAGESSTCNRDCTTASCGDAVLNATAGEACDEGSNNGTPLRCGAGCQGITAAACGNEVVEIGESCDAGGTSATCDSDCSMVACGDGTTNAAAGEACDDGSQNGAAGSTCSSACQPVEPLRLDGGACTLTRSHRHPTGLFLLGGAALVFAARRRRRR